MSFMEKVVLPVPTLIDHLNSQRYVTIVANAYSKEISAKVTGAKGEVSFEKFGLEIGTDKIGKFLKLFFRIYVMWKAFIPRET